jgi:hypothetical protein
MATKAERKKFSEAVKSILYHCGELGPDLPSHLRESFGERKLKAAVKATTEAYEDGFRPTVIQALVALQKAGHQAEAEQLVEFVVEDPAQRDELKRALPEPQEFHSKLEDLDVTPLMFEEACQFSDVTVGGVPAVYIYSEFSSSVPFARLQDWLNPENWPDRAPLLFRDITPTTKQATETWQQFRLWHERFREEATPFDDELVNYLSCDNATWNGFSVTAYDLDTKAVQGVKVDRGYLLVTELGNNLSAVKFVKIIGFNNPAENRRVYELRPFWMSWLRSVAEGQSDTKATATLTQAPEAAPGAHELGPGDLVLQWADAFTSTAGAYGQLAGNLVQGLSGPQFDWDDVRRAVANSWRTAVMPYAVAFTTTQKTFEQMVAPQVTGPAGFQTPTSSKGFGATAGAPATATLPLKPMAGALSTRVDLTEMRSISNASMVIPPGRLVAGLTGTADQPRLSVRVDPRGFWPGVYVGSARLGGGMATIPTFLFISDSVAA